MSELRTVMYYHCVKLIWCGMELYPQIDLVQFNIHYSFLFSFMIMNYDILLKNQIFNDHANIPSTFEDCNMHVTSSII